MIYPMPELPEVETVVRQLRKVLLGKTIIKVEIKDTKVIDFRILKILPACIINITRRGKSIIFTLDHDHYLLAHLRMTGHFHYVPSNKKDIHHEKYLSAIFYLNDHSFFTFNEIRRFGRIKLFTANELEQFSSSMGREPLDSSFTVKEFNSLLDRFPKAIIKTKLLDQSAIAGIGNIYAQEALYRAAIHPQRKIEAISSAKREKLYHSIRNILKQAIKHNGTTIQNFSHIDGIGEFQDFLSVYQKERCPKDHPIRKINQGGRGTYYCPRCQH